jgi:hypothetical protein
MPLDTSKYDDDKELSKYVCTNYRHLLTPHERAVGGAVLAEEKAAVCDNPVQADMMRKHWGPQNKPAVAESLRGGFAAFQHKARRRILAEHGDQVFVNRCAQCQRVVATPRARQCLWCGHDWHERG